MANTEFLNLKLPATSDNIADQINIDTPDNLNKIDASLKAVHTVTKESIAENYLSTHSIPSTAKRGKLDAKLRGQSVVNLLGTDGNCEDTSKWSNWQVTTALDSTNKVFGNNSIKITLSNTSGNIYKQLKTKLEPSKNYILSAYIKNVNVSIYTRLQFIGTENISINIPISTYFSRVALKIPASKIGGNNEIDVVLAGSIGQYAYVDGIMINEISAEEYNNLTVDELMAKYPYHDGLQGAKPTVKSCGKNLLYNGSGEHYIGGWKSTNWDRLTLSVVEDNKYKIVLTASPASVYQDIVVKPNTDYYIGGNFSGTTFPTIYSVVNGTINTKLRDNVGTFKTGNEAAIRVYLNNNTVGTGYADSIQLEEGSVATAYEPYRVTEVQYKTLDGQPITLNRLPNGVCDEITDDGKFIKRVAEKTLVEGDISVEYSGGNILVVRVVKPLDCVPFVDAVQDIILSSYGLQKPSTTYSTAPPEYIGSWATDVSQKLLFYFASGTTLAQAQTALAGTKIIYELAQPQILDTNATPLIAEPNGTVFITSGGTQPSVELSYPLNLGAVVDGLIEGQKLLSELVQSLITT